ncbi:rpsE, partial [Ophiophagus hannah]
MTGNCPAVESLLVQPPALEGDPRSLEGRKEGGRGRGRGREGEGGRERKRKEGRKEARKEERERGRKGRKF